MIDIDGNKDGKAIDVYIDWMYPEIYDKNKSHIILGLCELELIACYDGGVYWFLDYRFSDNSGGAFLNSQIYKDDKAAIFALISGTIKWTECHTEK